MLDIRSNGSKWLGEPPDELPALLARLATHKLEGVFVKRGFLRTEEKPGVIRYFGNFEEISAVFDITTDEPRIHAIMDAALLANIRLHYPKDAARLW